MRGHSNHELRTPPKFWAAIHTSRPQNATSYRLKSLDGNRYFPPHEQPAALCAGRLMVGIQDLVAGTYEIVYYRDPANLESVLQTPDDRDPPLVQISQDAVVVSPVDFAVREQRQWQKYEHRELVQRRETATTKQIEALTANAIERDAALTATMKQFADLQMQLMAMQQTLLANSEKQTEALTKNFLALTETAAQKISQIKTDNLFSFLTEGARQIGTIAHAKVASGSESPSERRLREDAPRPALEGRRTAEPAEGKRRTQDAPPSPPSFPSSLPTAGAAATGTRRLPSVEIDWIDVCERQMDAPCERSPAAMPEAEPAEVAPLAARDASDAPSAALATVPDELRELVAQVPALHGLLASLGIVRDEALEKPAEWSYSWAWHAIKRRISRLTDSSIAILLSSFDNALGFLRELADLATPPPDLDEVAGVSQRTTTPSYRSLP